MFKMKKVIAFLLTVVMVFSSLPVSLATDGENQVTDTVRNTDIVLIPKEDQTEEEIIIPELLTLSSEQLSVNPLSEDRLEFLKGLIPGEETKSPKILWFTRIMNAIAPPKTGTYVGYAAFDIAMANPEEAQRYIVNVQLNNPIELQQEENVVIDSLTCELFHIHTDENGNDVLAETITEESGLEVTCQDDQITGFSFPTSDFSDFVLKYTVEFHTKEGGVFICNIIGAQDILLSVILDGIEIAEDGDTAAFMAEIASVSVSNPDVISLNQTENDWTFRVLKEFDTQESLQILMQDETEHTITVAATGITEIATENETAVISTVDNYYLPEEATAYAEIREGTEDDAAVAAVQEVAAAEPIAPEEPETKVEESVTVTEEQSAYQVLNVGLENVETEEYEGFDVTVNLDEELVGKDFRLYEVQDGQATDITDTLQLNADTQVDGSQNVQGFTFTTDSFAEYVLSYSLVTYYTTFDGQTFKITLNYGPEAGIPEGAELKVREILPEDPEYASYYNRAVNAVENRDDSEEETEQDRYARFFDIEIRKDNEKIEPITPVTVNISLSYMLEVSPDELTVVHFEEESPIVLESESNISGDTGDVETCFVTDGFSVFGVIGPLVSIDPLEPVIDLDGQRAKIMVGDYFLTGEDKWTDFNGTQMWVIEKTLNQEEAAEYTFEDTGYPGRYAISLTDSNGNKRFINVNRLEWNAQNASVTIGDSPTLLYVVKNSNTGAYSIYREYEFDGSNNNKYYLNVHWGNIGPGIGSYIQGDNVSFVFNTNYEKSKAMVLVKYGGQYYIVNNDGTLTHVEYDETDGTVEVEYPMIWTIMRNNSQTNGGHIYFNSEEVGFNGSQLASDWYRLYLDPSETGALKNEIGDPSITVSTVETHNTPETGEYYERIVKNRKEIEDKTAVSIDPFNDSTYRIHHDDQYLGLEFDDLGNPVRLVGQKTEDKAAEIVFATASRVPSASYLKNSVNHIDISITGSATVSVPLAYGDYYDSEGHIIKTVSGNETLQLKKDNLTGATPEEREEQLRITAEDMKRATISAARLDNHEVVYDAFYVTGYSGNVDTSLSNAQVRIEGSFLVADLRGTPYETVNKDWYDSNYNNYKTNVQNARRDNRIEYTVSVIKSLSYYLVDPEVGQLYDEERNPIIVTVDVGFAASFDYWNSENKCPAIHIYPYASHDGPDAWRAFGIDSSDWSGMDFKLGGGEDESTSTLVALEITKVIVDEDGKQIKLSTPLVQSFDIYKSTSDINTNVIGINVPNYSGEYLHYDSYNRIHSKDVRVATSGMGLVFDYDISPGMYYIVENPNDIQQTITSENGEIWSYKNTELDTEYVWRNDNVSGLHRSKTYTDPSTETYRSVPEVAGAYTGLRYTGTGSYDSEFWEWYNPKTQQMEYGGFRNGFVEFFVYNTYKLETSDLIIKKIIDSPVAEDSTSKTFTFTVKVTRPNNTLLTGTYGDYTFVNGETTVTITGSGEVTIPDLPQGVSYTVTETPDDDYDLTESSGTQGVLGADGATASFKNKRKVGNLEVTKTVTGSYAAGETDTYPFTVKKGEKYVTAERVGTATAYTYTGLSDTDPEYVIRDGETIRFEKLPAGEYTVEEGSVSESGYVITTTYTVAGEEVTTATAQVTKGTTAAVGIENHYRDAKLIITKTISGITPETAADKITITVKDSKGNKLLDEVKLTAALFTKSGSTYTATLTSKDEAAYAKYLVPDGTYTVTETVVEPDHYGLVGSKYAVTARENVEETDAINGRGYLFQLTDADTSTGEIDYTNVYKQPDPPDKKETGVTRGETTLIGDYEGIGVLGNVKVGDIITYEINYQNYKSVAATVTIKDKLDDNVQLVFASDGGQNSGESTSAINGEPGGGTVTWTLTNVPAGKEGKVTLQVKVLKGALKSNGGSGNVINSGDTATVKVGDDSEYKLNTVENPLPEKKETGATRNGKDLEGEYEGTGVLGNVKVGDIITYEINYRNYKDEAATVTIKDKLDDNVQLVFASDGGQNSGASTNAINGEPGGGTVTWTLTNVPADKEGKVTLQVKVLKGALKSNGGNGNVINKGDTATVQVGNDSEFQLNTVENPLPEKKETGATRNGKDLEGEYEGTGVLGNVKVGDIITYEINYRNYKDEAANVTIKDKLDNNVQFVDASDNGAVSGASTSAINGESGGGTVTWTLTNVPAGKEGKVTLWVKVLKGALKSNGGSSNVINSGDTATVQVGNDSEFKLNTVENPLPEKKETKPYEGTGVLGNVKVGGIITYEINYRNYKDKAATVTIKDKLDDNVQFVKASNGGAVSGASTSAINGEPGGGTVTWTLEGIAAGAEGKVTLEVKVLKGALKSNGGSGNVINDGDTATVKVGNDSEFKLNTIENPLPEKKETGATRKGEDLEGDYEGTGVLGFVKVGDIITYEINYRNYKDKATTVTIKDKLDNNVQFVKASNGGAVSGASTSAINGEPGGGTVTWTLEGIAAGAEGKVTLEVKVLKGALKSNGGSGNVINDGDTAIVKVGNDSEFKLNTIENPLPEKKETNPYEGTGLLGFVHVGDHITYEISYQNYKKEATTVTIKDQLDKNVAFVSASNGGKNNGGTVIWTLVNVPAGEKGKVTLVVEVLPGALVSNGGTGSVINGGDTATVQVGNDNEFTLDEVENPVPEKKETAPYKGTGLLGNVHVGDEITYEITYRNYKTAAADVTIKDKLDKNVQFVSASDGGKLSGGVVTWTLKDVEAGKDGSVTLTVKVLPGALVSNGGTGSVINDGDTATVQVANDSEFKLNTVENPVPEKKETKPYEGTGLLGNVHVGDEITYELSYRNYKTTAATVTIKDQMDKNVAFVSASDGGKNNSGTVVWTLADVPAGQAGVVTLTVKVLPGALVSNGGTGSVINDGDTATVQVGNDAEFKLNTVENPVPEKKETKPYEGTGLLGFVHVGDEITYELSYRNYKTIAATVTIKDKLDKNVAFVSASDGGKNNGGTVTWTLADVPAGQAGVVTLTVKVLPGALVSNGGGGSVINDGDTATVQVGNDAEFKLNTVENPVPEKKETKPYVGTGLLGAVKVGDEITYELSYRNYKTAAATVTIKDKLDKNVAFVSASDGGVNSNGTVIWTLADVPAAKSGVVTLTVKVLPGALVSNGGTGSVINDGDTATVQVGNDAEFTLNTVENPVPEEPEKKETKPYEGTGLLGNVHVGDEITYEISYKNYKNEAADVVIRDRLDRNVEFVSASDGGVNNGGVVNWTLKSVPAGQEGKVTLSVKVLPGALVSNGGTGSVINGGDTASVKVGNDNEFTLNTVENPVPEKKETKPYKGTGLLGFVKVGDEITYEISYRNYKTEAATVTIRDKLDKNVAFVSASDGGTNNSGTVVWTLADVPAGQAGAVTLTVKVLPGALVSNGGTGSVINSGDTATVKVGNDAEFKLNTVENPVPEKREIKPYKGTGLLGAVNVGDEITYEISYRNYKTEAATVTIKDKLDVNAAFVSASNGGKNSSGTVIWTLADVPAGKAGTVTLTVRVLPGAVVSAVGPGKVVNNGDTATVQVGNDAEFKLNTVENPVNNPPTTPNNPNRPNNPGTVSVTVRKIWDDNNNENGRRPSHLRVTLSNGSQYFLTEQNGWTVTVNNLPAEQNGVPITYTWSEQSVPGYVHTETRKDGNTTTFINQYREVVVPTPPGKKKRSGGGLTYLDDYETPLGVQVIINHVGDCYE